MSSQEKGELGSPPFQTKSPSTSQEVFPQGPQDSWATRNGLNLTSFKKKESGADIELERPMKTRHLHMISIGEQNDNDLSSDVIHHADALDT